MMTLAVIKNAGTERSTQTYVIEKGFTPKNDDILRFVKKVANIRTTSATKQSVAGPCMNSKLLFFQTSVAVPLMKCVGAFWGSM